MSDMLWTDGTPVADIMEHNAELKAEVQQLRKLLRTIEAACDAPYWDTARRWRVRDLALSARRPEAVRLKP